MFARLVLTFLLVCACSSFALGQERVPVPEQAAIDQASELIQSVFKQDFKQAKTRQAKAALSALLLKQGRETKDDVAGRFVLLSEARRLAGEAADFSAAWAAIEELAKWHGVDVITLKVESFELATKSANATEDQKRLAAIGFALIDEAIVADAHELAKQVCTLVSATAREARDFTLASNALQRKKEVEKLEKTFTQVRAAREKLASAPTDPAANLTVGRYLCFVKANWEEGVPLLALGADAELQAIAKRELQNPTVAAARTAIADSWWDFAQKLDGQAKTNMIGRAGYWYSQALPELSGLSKARIEKRLEAITHVEAAQSVDRPLPATKARKLPSTFVNSVGMPMILLPAGTFLMGSPRSEPGRKDDESPQHTVRFTRPYYMAAHEVKVGQFRAFANATGYKTEPERDDKGIDLTWRAPKWSAGEAIPVVQITWNDADEFCKWLSKVEKRTYRLPTEAEWEYGCRAGTKTAYSSGANIEALAAFGWTKENEGVWCRNVATAKPNAWGLYDMHGNVLEWCATQYAPYSGDTLTDPQPTVGNQMVVRGGGWRYEASQARSAARDKRERGLRMGSVVGFRVMCEALPVPRDYSKPGR